MPEGPAKRPFVPRTLKRAPEEAVAKGVREWVDKILKGPSLPGPRRAMMILLPLTLLAAGVGSKVENCLDTFDEGGTPIERYTPEPEIVEANKAMNDQLPADWPMVGGLKVHPNVAKMVDDKDSPPVLLVLPGKGKDQKVPLLPEAAEEVYEIVKDIRTTFDLVPSIRSGHRDHVGQKAMQEARKQLAAGKGRSPHHGKAVDVGREDAFGKETATLDLKGEAIYVKDVEETEEGKKRFGEVIAKIFSDEKDPEKLKKIQDDWIRTIRRDYNNSVWGLHDVTMEIWQKHGWSIGHGGRLATPVMRPPNGSEREAWHAEPMTREEIEKRVRFSSAYNANIKAYRAYPPEPLENWVDIGKHKIKQVAAQALEIGKKAGKALLKRFIKE